MRDCKVKRCSLVRLPVMGDQRGNLIAIEADAQVPFKIARVYYVYATKPGVDRGFHAHRSLRQLAVAVSGACTIMLDDGENQDQVRLDDPARGLLIDGLIWREMRDFSPDCVLLVLADRPYDEGDYIRDHAAFLDAVGEDRR